MITVLDLFSGIGRFSLGLERTGGFKTVAFCEIDNYCQKVLHKHWPNIYIHSDIRTLGAKHFEQYRKPDLICGGFPCQDISVGNQQGKGLDGQRSGLWWEMHRIINELRPSWVRVENVPNLRTKGAAQVISALEEIDYTVLDPFVVGAWAIEAKHKRNRVWIMAYARQFLRTERMVSDDSGETSTRRTETQERSTDRKLTSLGPAIAEGLLSRFSPEPTMARMAHGVPNRVDRTIALGNSVVPQIPELFGHAILQLDRQFREAK